MVDLAQSSTVATHLPSFAVHCPSFLQASDAAQSLSDPASHDSSLTVQRPSFLQTLSAVGVSPPKQWYLDTAAHRLSFLTHRPSLVHVLLQSGSTCLLRSTHCPP